MCLHIFWIFFFEETKPFSCICASAPFTHSKKVWMEVIKFYRHHKNVVWYKNTMIVMILHIVHHCTNPLFAIFWRIWKKLTLQSCAFPNNKRNMQRLHPICFYLFFMSSANLLFRILWHWIVRYHLSNMFATELRYHIVRKIDLDRLVYITPVMT